MPVVDRAPLIVWLAAKVTGFTPAVASAVTDKLLNVQLPINWHVVLLEVEVNATL